MALIRYPGSKEKLVSEIADRFPDQMRFQLWSTVGKWEYREPFFGAGAIGFGILKTLDPSCRVWLNDIDPGMVSLWQSVRDYPDGLTKRVYDFTPTTEAFHVLKKEDGRSDLPIDQIGFRKLALHRISFSGLGFKAGGPIGGMDQEKATYKVNCRWKKETIAHDIGILGNRLRSFEDFRFTNLDFEEVIRDAPRECFIYADPPYYKKGSALYKFSMTDEDHVRLRDALKESKASWVLSYDDHERIRELYSWATIEPVHIVYTMEARRKVSGVAQERPKNREIVIMPPSQSKSLVKSA